MPEELVQWYMVSCHGYFPGIGGAVLHGIANTFTVACAPVIFVWFTLVPDWLG